MGNEDTIPHAPSSPPVWLQVCLLLVIAGLALALRWPIADIPLERDEGEYAYIAQRWLQAEVPYRHAFDQKPPLVFAVYALIFLAFGQSVAAIHWGAQLYLIATAFFLFLIGKRLFTPPTGILAAAFLLLTTMDVSVLGNAFNAESVMLLPLVAGMYAAVRTVESASVRWACLTGMLSAAALLGKQVALYDGMFYFLMMTLLIPVSGGRPSPGDSFHPETDACRSSQWFLLPLSFTVGFAGILALVTGYFAWHGALREFWDCVVGFNLKYASTVPLTQYPSRFVTELLKIGICLGPIFVLAGAALLPLIGPRPIVVTQRYPYWLTWAWLLFSMLGTWTGGYFRPHYYIQMLPALSLLAGAGVLIVCQLPGLRRFPAARYGLTALAAAYTVSVSAWYYLPGLSPTEKSYRTYHFNYFPVAQDVARHIREHSPPNAAVFVLGVEPEIYFYAQRRAASRYIFVYPLMMPYEDTRDRQRGVLKELRDNSPCYVVIMDAHLPALREPGTPSDLEEGWRNELRRSYRLDAVVMPAMRDGPFHLRVVTPAAGVEAWQAAQASVAAAPDKQRHYITIYRRHDERLETP
ncbi:MAG: ArnT family glycosyltransferase [Gemmataceae bacterium]